MIRREGLKGRLNSKSVYVAFLILLSLSFAVGFLLSDNNRIGTLLGWALGLMVAPAIGYFLTRRGSPKTRIVIMTILWMMIVSVMSSLEWLARSMPT